MLGERVDPSPRLSPRRRPRWRRRTARSRASVAISRRVTRRSRTAAQGGARSGLGRPARHPGAETVRRSTRRRAREAGKLEAARRAHREARAARPAPRDVPQPSPRRRPGSPGARASSPTIRKRLDSLATPPGSASTAADPALRRQLDGLSPRARTRRDSPRGAGAEVDALKARARAPCGRASPPSDELRAMLATLRTRVEALAGSRARSHRGGARRSARRDRRRPCRAYPTRSTRSREPRGGHRPVAGKEHELAALHRHFPEVERAHRDRRRRPREALSRSPETDPGRWRALGTASRDSAGVASLVGRVDRPEAASSLSRPRRGAKRAKLGARTRSARDGRELDRVARRRRSGPSRCDRSRRASTTAVAASAPRTSRPHTEPSEDAYATARAHDRRPPRRASRQPPGDGERRGGDGARVGARPATSSRRAPKTAASRRGGAQARPVHARATRRAHERCCGHSTLFSSRSAGTAPGRAR